MNNNDIYEVKGTHSGYINLDSSFVGEKVELIEIDHMYPITLTRLVMATSGDCGRIGMPLKYVGKKFHILKCT